MISSKDLKRCINLLASINNDASDNATKMKLLEIGYVLKQELDNVSLIESMGRDIDHRTNSMTSLDVQRLLKDNIELFNERKRLIDQNHELRRMVESRIAAYEQKINLLNREIMKFNSKIDAIL